jgi:hypothetical protein
MKRVSYNHLTNLYFSCSSLLVCRRGLQEKYVGKKVSDNFKLQLSVKSDVVLFITAENLSNLGIFYSSIDNPVQSTTLFIEASDLTLRFLHQSYAILSEQEKMKLLKLKTSQFDYLSSLLFTQSIKQTPLIKQVYDNELALKGMVLEDQKEVLSSIRKSNDNTALQLYEQWYSNKAFLGKQILLPLAERVPFLIVCRQLLINWNRSYRAGLLLSKVSNNDNLSLLMISLRSFSREKLP